MIISTGYNVKHHEVCQLITNISFSSDLYL